MVTLKVRNTSRKIKNMKQLQLLLLSLFMLTAGFSNAGMIVLEGKYMGKNIFVKNPFGGAGVGFCVFEVTVNGNLSPDEVNQSAFEIDFGKIVVNKVPLCGSFNPKNIL